MANVWGPCSARHHPRVWWLCQGDSAATVPALDDKGHPDECVAAARFWPCLPPPPPPPPPPSCDCLLALRCVIVFGRFLEAPATVSVGDFLSWDRTSKLWYKVEALDWTRRMVKVHIAKTVRALGAGPLRLRFVGVADNSTPNAADELGGSGGGDGAAEENRSKPRRRGDVPPMWIHMSKLSGALVRRAKLTGRGQPVVYELPRPSPEWGLRQLRQWVREDKKRAEEEARKAREEEALRELEDRAAARRAAKLKRVAVCREWLWKLDDTRCDDFQDWLKVGGRGLCVCSLLVGGSKVKCDVTTCCGLEPGWRCVVHGGSIAPDWLRLAVRHASRPRGGTVTVWGGVALEC